MRTQQWGASFGLDRIPTRLRNAAVVHAPTTAHSLQGVTTRQVHAERMIDIAVTDRRGADVVQFHYDGTEYYAIFTYTRHIRE